MDKVFRVEPSGDDLWKVLDVDDRAVVAPFAPEQKIDFQRAPGDEALDRFAVSFVPHLESSFDRLRVAALKWRTQDALRSAPAPRFQVNERMAAYASCGASSSAARAVKAM